MKFINKNEHSVDSRYSQLLSASRHVAASISETPATGLNGAAKYIHHVSCELIKAASTGDEWSDLQGTGILLCLQRLNSVWPLLSRGEIEGEQAIAGDLILWKRAMTEWPMAGYAKMAADFMIQNKLLSGGLLELGAGVGSCGALVADYVGEGYIRTDLQPYLLKRQKIAGSVNRYDFNLPGEWRNLDTVFAVNALHCAKNKEASLGYIYDMLCPGGVVLLGEGVPYTDSNMTPWPLNGFLGLFRGWWDIGGFIPRQLWMATMTKVGFRNVSFSPWLNAEHDLGGIIWAQR